MLHKTLRIIVATIIIAIANLCAAQPMLLDEERGIPTIAPLIRDITPAVVNIAVVSQAPTQTNPLFEDPFFREFFDMPPDLSPQPRLSAGSGVIVDAQKGHILTNNHVIEDSIEIHVTLTDRRELVAEVIGTDPATDVALLKVDADDMTEIEMGDSELLEVGDFVVALGNPFGLGQTVTSGIVSALGRSGINPEGFEDFIQTDASINPGNSGGALVTLDSRLIGLNSAIIAPSGGNVGIGFAVPVNMVRAVMDQLIEFGEVRRGQLGVMIQDLTPDLAEALGIKADRGAIISQVVEDSAAEVAGLLVGDVVLSVNGSPVEDSGDLRNLVGTMQSGSVLRLEVERDGNVRSIRATIRTKARGERSESFTVTVPLDGAEFAQLDPDMPGYGEVQGVAVVSVAPDSTAHRAGLRAGDVITAVNNTPVQTVEDLKARLPEPESGPTALSVYREGRSLFLVVR